MKPCDSKERLVHIKEILEQWQSTVEIMMVEDPDMTPKDCYYFIIDEPRSCPLEEDGEEEF